MLSKRRTPGAFQPVPVSAPDLPPDLLDKSQRRLSVFALVLTVSSIVAFVIGPPLWNALGWNDVGLVHSAQALFIVVSLGMFLLARFGRQRKVILDAGLAYFLLLCFVGSLGQASVILGTGDRVIVLTLAHILIVAYPLIVPTPPGRTLVVALVAATSVPLSFLVLDVMGRAAIPGVAYIGPFMFALFSAALAVVGSRVIYGLGRAVVEARELGSYRLEERLGAGGMGEVWMARHRMLARPAAVKLIRQEAFGANDPGVVLARFEREAQVTASLRSPHTIGLYDFGVSDDGTFYYVMELLDGFDTQTLVERFGVMPAERVVHLLRQLCDSLGEAHAVGLVHRDIKPSNVYVCRYGREADFVKVLDFGLVKSSSHGDADLSIAAGNVVAGTPGFMAPEQILGNGPIDARTDIYGVGCLAYWLLTGQPVFEGSTLMETLMKHVHEPAIAPSKVSEMEIPESLDAIVLACLEKEPGRRPSDIDQVLRMLEECPLPVSWTADRSSRWWSVHAPR